MEQIPTFDTASFSEEVTLDDEQFRLAFHYNTRGDFWVMDIMDRDSNPLAMGIKVVASHELIRRYRYKAIPPGALSTADPADSYLRVGRDDLPNRVALVYLTEAEHAAL